MSGACGNCFEAGSNLLRLDQALALINDRFDPVIGEERVKLADAVGRVLAADLRAVAPLPGFDNSAMDGYALRHADLPGPLPLAGQVAAGHRPPLVPPGHAVRILTGAMLPAGLDSVAIQEEVHLLPDGRVALPPALPLGANCRRVGQDVALGALLLSAGRTLRPADIALAAAQGWDSLPVRRPLRVALFSTGDELREPGQDAAPPAIHDSNRYLLRALLARQGCAVTDLGILADDATLIRRVLAQAAENHDLVLTSGGMSVGDADHVRPAVEALGALSFWKLAIKPGKPLALGRIGGAVFCGLPGNPSAVLVTFLLVARPLIQRLSGARVENPPRFAVRAGFAHAKKAGRREFLPVRLGQGADGSALALPLTGMFTGMVQADGLLELTEEREHLAAGDLAPLLPLT
ncbi:gephyrin-like molybdotransferase Glp [Niveispirillum sp. BGYR6]|uniref:molybdopterin molybdotransferase MoeA n=1 Tax=Niveispirillum sp. BGYR6 TaxID=2971249 RepID=UPI0022B98C59|nr:gephyrin-like molybdotransferase Glp [Niveispirillum sp. BGYR6]MDG5494708.1 molybdopterin molybdotransferase MoeA [Niveispirillum sp. BGYR6]